MPVISGVRPHGCVLLTGGNEWPHTTVVAYVVPFELWHQASLIASACAIVLTAASTMVPSFTLPPFFPETQS